MTTRLGRRSGEIKSSPGYAWAVRRETVTKHGDSATLRAAYGYFEEAIRFQYMNDRQKEHYCTWARRFYDTVGGKVTFAPGDHLWLGTEKNRRYRERIEKFRRFEFHPFADIPIDRGGGWRWDSNKRKMHEYVRCYFASRREESAFRASVAPCSHGASWRRSATR